jgi:heme A synthase
MLNKEAIMRLFYLSLINVLATWILLVIGGLVNPMGASLACPDWYFIPTCNGELLPEMAGGVLYEHGHRLWASMVGVITLVLMASILWSNRTDRVTKQLSVLAVFLVAFQGTLGGVTVLLGLSAFVSTLHLVTAMGFFCLLIYIAYRLYPASSNEAGLALNRNWVGAATLFVLFQILLGGLIRHVGAGLACGDDWLSCGPSFWPDWHLGQLHMLHRMVGYALALLIMHSCAKALKAARRSDSRLVAQIAWLPPLFVVVQVCLGIATIATVRSVPLVVLHTGVGALLLASLFVLFLSMKPRGIVDAEQTSTVSHTQNRWATH